MDTEVLRSLLLDAIELRTSLIHPADNSGRLVNGSGDGLPGLIVDLYDTVLLLELTSENMIAQKDELISSLADYLNPEGIIVRKRGSDSSKKTVIIGKIPSSHIIVSSGSKFLVNLQNSTFHFFDQTDNRILFSSMTRGYKLLDTFAYSGAWGICAMVAQAREVTFLDNSLEALKLTEENWKLNKLNKKSMKTIEGDFFTEMDKMATEKCMFDGVILDPPLSLCDTSNLKKMNKQAIKLLHKGGLLATSCHKPSVSFNEFSKILGQAAKECKRFCRILYHGNTALSFPISANFPESSYLKFIIARLS
jgi:23S rRNA (cytosine1962-C5)-methyltransferase